MSEEKVEQRIGCRKCLVVVSVALLIVIPAAIYIVSLLGSSSFLFRFRKELMLGFILLGMGVISYLHHGDLYRRVFLSFAYFSVPYALFVLLFGYQHHLDYPIVYLFFLPLTFFFVSAFVFSSHPRARHILMPLWSVLHIYIVLDFYYHMLDVGDGMQGFYFDIYSFWLFLRSSMITMIAVVAFYALALTRVSESSIANRHEKK